MKKKMVLFILSFMLLFSYASAENFRNVSADELKKMLDNRGTLAVVDARTSLEYSPGTYPEGHKYSTGETGDYSRRAAEK
jgi:hypothetical protein